MDLLPDRGYGPRPAAITGMMKLVLMWSWFCFTVFVFTLPFQSMLFNDVWDYWETCHTPAEEIVCYGNKTFLEIAESYRGTWADRWREGKNGAPGRYIGCGCGEGVYADWMCSIETVEKSFLGMPPITNGVLGFTVSYYIGTAPTTGAMAGFSAFPIAAMWWHGLGNAAVVRERFGVDADSTGHKLIWGSLLVYQGCYFVFLTCSGCLFGVQHLLAVDVFLGSAIVHFGIIAYFSHKVRGSLTDDIIIGVVIAASLGMGLGFASYAFPELQGYGFFCAEAFGLSCVYLITPALAVWESRPKDEDGSYRNMAIEA